MTEKPPAPDREPLPTPDREQVSAPGADMLLASDPESVRGNPRTVEPTLVDRRRFPIWAFPVAVLVALWLYLAYSSGGYVLDQWLAPALAVALFGLIATLMVAYPRRPRQISLVFLGLFLLYAIWVLASTQWAASPQSAWEETNRTFTYLVALGLALTFLTDAGARLALRYLLLAAGVLLVVVAVWRLATIPDLQALFLGNRYVYPTTYPNNNAALHLILFWPLLWLAADPGERAPIRGVALGTVTGLLMLAILSQSRGSVVAMVVALVLTFLLSPARLRTFVVLLVPAVLTVYAFPRLNEYWRLGPTEVGGVAGARTVAVAAMVAFVIGAALAFLERWISVGRRTRLACGTVVVVAVAALLLYGGLLFDQRVGDTRAWLSDTWKRFTADEITVLPGAEGAGSDSGTKAQRVSETGAASRLAVLSLSGRVDLWRVAWGDFRSFSLQGVGAGNYVFTLDRWRHRVHLKAQQPHSIELLVLSETGLVGGVLFFGAMLVGLIAMLWPRFVLGARLVARAFGRRAPPAPSRWGEHPKAYAFEAALAVGVLYWLVHDSGEWIWHMPGVTLGALLVLALGVARVDARAGNFWPRLSRALWLTRKAGADSGGGVGPLDDLEIRGEEDESFFRVSRRSDRYEGKRKRRLRREERRRQLSALLQPPGLLSHVFRWLALALSVGLLISLALPFLSLRYRDVALHKSEKDQAAALASASRAASFQPFDPRPYVVRGRVFETAARKAAATGHPDRRLAVYEYLALALGAHEEAAQVEPVSWVPRYNAGLAALNFMAARRGLKELRVEGQRRVPGVDDWSALLETDNPKRGTSALSMPLSGTAAGSLATSSEALQTAAHLRGLSVEELRVRARQHLLEAQARNPLSPEIALALRSVSR